MCRWLAYLGPPIFMDTLLTKPKHSLIDQSLHAQLNYIPGVGNWTTNGDGFGIGWYGERPRPGRYRDIRPAWNDENLRCLAEQIRSPLFVAHVRAATGGGIQRTNSHPFLHENWLFQHNGEIPEFQKIKRELQFEVAPELFPYILGSTDSETCFYLALTYGLAEDAPLALQRMAARVERARSEAGLEKPFRLTCAATDGQKIYALRYSSDCHSKTLFHNRNVEAVRQLEGDYEGFPPDGLIIVSEPLDELKENWVEMPESTLLIAEAGRITTQPFEPG